MTVGAGIQASMQDNASTQRKEIDPVKRLQQYQDFYDNYKPHTEPGDKLNGYIADFKTKLDHAKQIVSNDNYLDSELAKKFPPSAGWNCSLRDASLLRETSNQLGNSETKGKGYELNQNHGVNVGIGKDGPSMGGSSSMGSSVSQSQSNTVETMTVNKVVEGKSFTFTMPANATAEQKTQFVEGHMQYFNQQQKELKNAFDQLESSTLYVGYKNAQFVLEKYQDRAREGLVNPGEGGRWDPADTGTWLKINGYEIKPLLEGDTIKLEKPIKMHFPIMGDIEVKGLKLSDDEMGKAALLKLDPHDPRILSQIRFERAKSGFNEYHEDGIIIIKGDDGKLIDFQKIADEGRLEIDVTHNLQKSSEQKYVQHQGIKNIDSRVANDLSPSPSDVAANQSMQKETDEQKLNRYLRGTGLDGNNAVAKNPAENNLETAEVAANHSREKETPEQTLERRLREIGLGGNNVTPKNSGNDGPDFC